jgi:uncharacterized protein
MKSTCSSTPIELDFYQPELSFENCNPRYWNDLSEVKSHFWNALSSLLPNVEYFAIRVLHTIIPSISDEKLKGEVIQFCKQESMHGNIHTRFNTQQLHTAYPLLIKLERWENSLFVFFASSLSSKLYLSLFVAVEHWTAAFSQHGLDDPDIWFPNCDTAMYKLWEWHAVEELAHKSQQILWRAQLRQS